jgi:alpha-glucosidase
MKAMLPSVLLSLALSPASSAQWRPLGPATSVSPLSDGVEISAGGARVRLNALSPSVIRVRYAPSGIFPPDQSFAVSQEQFPSHPSVRVEDSPEAVGFDAGSVRVRVDKSTLGAAFLDPRGVVVLEDRPGWPASFNGAAFRVWKSMPADEHYFGLGDKAGPLDRRDQAFTMWNMDAFGWQESTDPLYKSIPFFLALRGGSAYGLFLDNTYRSSFDFGKESRDSFSFGSDGGCLDYYFFYGPGPKKVLQDFTALTGRTPLPPLFSLGYQQCRYSYYPEARVREVAGEFRKRRIPADVIYLDIDYQEANRPFTVDRKRFPHFEEMVRDLRGQGFKTVAITDLHIAKLPGYAPYDQGLAGDHFVKNPDGSVYVGNVWPGDSVFPDFTRSGTRRWWGTLYQGFVDAGLRGFWNDMNEPAVFRPGKTMPLDTVHRVEERKTDHREVHNVFGMENARATYEGLLALRPAQRPFVLTRAAFAGAQRYAASWTGDNSATWNHMRLSVPGLLSLGLSGYPFVGDDIGGFWGSPSAELLTRWTALGAFNPVFRNHAMKGSRDREPWVDGPEHEAIRRKFIELRYRLLPYAYTRMEEASRTGVPLMRPVFLEFPAAHEELLLNGSEFFFGESLLVAPKVWESSGGYEAELPPGDWFDYWTGERKKGGRKIWLDPPLDSVPVFVRAGAILPEQPVVQSVDETPSGPLELKVFPGADCRGDYYIDDGEGFGYLRGEFLRGGFSCREEARSLRVDIGPWAGTFKPWFREIRVKLPGAGGKFDAAFIEGREVPLRGPEGPEGTLSLDAPWRPAPVTIVLRRPGSKGAP